MNIGSHFTLRIEFEESTYDSIREAIQTLGIESFEEGEVTTNEDGDPELVSEFSLIKIRLEDRNKILGILSILKKYFPSATFSVAEGDNSYLDEWKKFASPIQITDKIIIEPSWMDSKEKSNSNRLILDPGYAFGSGSHETTILCAREIERLSKLYRINSMLDVGCGSGILSLIACRIGVTNIVGIDIDELAINASKENALKNSIPGVHFATTPIAEIESKFDLVVANIISSVLFEMRDDLLRSVKPNGILVLSGILREEIEDVALKFGFENFERKEMGEWGLVTFTL